MPLVTNLGLFLDRATFTTGGLRSLINEYKQTHIHGRHPDYSLGLYRRSIGPPAPPWTRVWSSGYADFGASITAYRPLEDIAAYITAWHTGQTKDLTGYITGFYPNMSTLSSVIKGYCSTSTQLHEYTTIIVSAFGGFSVFRRLITKVPDLYASLHGFDYSALTASISLGYRSTRDLAAFISAIGAEYSDIFASLITLHTDDVAASLVSIPPSNLLATITSVNSVDINANVVPIPYLAMYASIGGHLPEDISGYLLVNPPVDLPVFIRSGNSSSSSVAANLTISSKYTELVGNVMAYTSSVSELPVSITVKGLSYLLASISGWGASSLSASISSVYMSSLLSSIWGVGVEATNDIAVFLRATSALNSDVSSYIKGWISTHTTDNPVSLGKIHNPPKTMIITAFGGFSIFRPEITYGVLPDLRASLTVLPRGYADLFTYISPQQRTSYDLSASIACLTRRVIYKNISFEFVNASFLSALITAFSGYGTLSGEIRPVRSGSTNTADNAYWAQKVFNIQPILGTTRGLAILSALSSTYKKLSFVNPTDTPDLWAILYGWAISDFSASICAVPTITLLASIAAIGFDRISDIYSSISSFNTSSITASVSTIGGFSQILSSISSSGAAAGLTAEIYSYFSSAGSLSIGVSTIPFSDLYATINYSSSVIGRQSSSIRALSGFLNVLQYNNSSLTASIAATTDTYSITSFITGMKITKPRILNIIFRSRTRTYYDAGGTICGLERIYATLGASIASVINTSNVYASITAKRYKFTGIEKLSPIEVYNIVSSNATLVKEIEVRFGSHVPKYIYDSIASSVYKATYDDKWVLNLVADTTTSDFFDKTASKTVSIDDITYYSSVDEAIRAAIDILSVGNYSVLYATIAATGGYGALNSSINIIQRFQDITLNASIMPVLEIPFLTAFIYSYSRAVPLSCVVKGIDSSYESLLSILECVRYDELNAEITGV